MKQENFDYLSKQVYNTGFNSSINEQLKEQMQSGVKEFTIAHSMQMGKDNLDSTLSFSRSEQGYYFFNKYDLTLQKENGDRLDRTFYVDKNNSYKLEESYNLLSGRSVYKDKVNKEKQSYNVWEQLDFTAKDKYGNYEIKSYGDRYGFDLEKSISTLPIIFNVEEEKYLFIDNIKLGHRELVNMEVNGEKVERYVEANPKMKRMDVFDKVDNQLNTNLDNVQKTEIAKGKSKGEKLDVSKGESPKKVNTEKKSKTKKVGV